MLRSVLERLEAAEVDGRLDLWVVAATRVRLRIGSGWCARRAALASASSRPAILEQRRVDAVREVAKFLHRLVDRGAKLVENRPGPLRVRVDELADRSEVRLERDEVLLGAVVEVALDPAPLGVGGGDDARPRRPQLLGLSPKLRQATPAARNRAGRCGGRGRSGARARRVRHRRHRRAVTPRAARRRSARTALHRERPARRERRPLHARRASRAARPRSDLRRRPANARERTARIR